MSEAEPQLVIIGKIIATGEYIEHKLDAGYDEYEISEELNIAIDRDEEFVTLLLADGKTQRFVLRDYAFLTFGNPVKLAKLRQLRRPR